jgi:hypothetical protein
VLDVAELKIISVIKVLLLNIKVLSLFTRINWLKKEMPVMS